MNEEGKKSTEYGMIHSHLTGFLLGEEEKEQLLGNPQVLSQFLDNLYTFYNGFYRNYIACKNRGFAEDITSAPGVQITFKHLNGVYPIISSLL